MQCLLSTLVVVVSLLTVPANAGQPVELELMLAVDASGSVDDGEFELQMRGFSEAFRHPDVQAAIRKAGDGGVAVALMQWSDGVRQIMPVDWSLLQDSQSAIAFANRLDATGRKIPSGGTAIYGAVNFAIHEFRRSGFDGRRRVIDISGDGRSDLIVPTLAARDQAVADGITINGLAMFQEQMPNNRPRSLDLVLIENAKQLLNHIPSPIKIVLTTRVATPVHSTPRQLSIQRQHKLPAI